MEEELLDIKRENYKLRKENFELIQDNTKLKEKLNLLDYKLKQKIIVETNQQLINNFIHKQDIRDKIKELEKDKCIYFGNRGNGKTYRTIQILKELLGGNEKW